MAAQQEEEAGPLRGMHVDKDEAAADSAAVGTLGPSLAAVAAAIEGSGSAQPKGSINRGGADGTYGKLAGK